MKKAHLILLNLLLLASCSSNYQTINIKINDEELAEILTVDKETWRQELEGIKGWYAKFDHLPEELLENLAKLEEDLK